MFTFSENDDDFNTIIVCSLFCLSHWWWFEKIRFLFYSLQFRFFSSCDKRKLLQSIIFVNFFNISEKKNQNESNLIKLLSYNSNFTSTKLKRVLKYWIKYEIQFLTWKSFSVKKYNLEFFLLLKQNRNFFRLCDQRKFIKSSKYVFNLIFNINKVKWIFTYIS
jgi:hypothetical protein